MLYLRRRINCFFFGWRKISDAAVSNDVGCWNAPDFYDSTGGGCDLFDWINEHGDAYRWYGLDEHCDIYGEDAGVGGNLAKDVC